MSIRLRFTIWAAAIMLSILLTLSFGLYYMMERNLQHEMDQRITSVWQTLIRNPDLYVDRETGEWVSALQNPEPFASPGLYIQVLRASDLSVVGKTDNLGNEEIPISQDHLSRNSQGERVYYDQSVTGADIRIYAAPAYYQNSLLAYIQVAESQEPMQQTLKQLTTILIVGTMLGTVLAAGAAWLVADAALRPVRRMAATARAIGGTSDLSQRVASPRTGDEVERLAETFNAMLDRLEVAFDAHRQFVADASHELRTPLTALRGNTDILQAMVRDNRIDPELLSESLDDIGSETDRMSRLVHDLLMLARADVGWSPNLSEEIDLAGAALDAERIHRPLAREHDLQVEVPEEEVLVSGDADQIRQLMLILLDNARTHTPPGTRVHFRVATEGEEAVLEVADDGPGFAPEHAERIFDRFYRTDNARTRTSGGTGLGLAIARWIAETHGGSIRATSTPGQGATFTVRLPLRRAAPDAVARQRFRAAQLGQAAPGVRT